jgi:hypothetical protein
MYRPSWAGGGRRAAGGRRQPDARVELSRANHV